VSRKEIRFHPAARQELRAAVLFYEGEATGLGRDLLQEVRAALSRLAEWPASGTPDGSDIRRVVLARFPFTVVYQVLGDALVIVAVMHQRQRPGYWKDRT
jgi:plasmid stabilization system protein ParE